MSVLVISRYRHVHSVTVSNRCWKINMPIRSSNLTGSLFIVFIWMNRLKDLSRFLYKESSRSFCGIRNDKFYVDLLGFLLRSADCFPMRWSLPKPRAFPTQLARLWLTHCVRSQSKLRQLPLEPRLENSQGEHRWLNKTGNKFLVTSNLSKFSFI